jgi:hypothetical protein
MINIVIPSYKRLGMVTTLDSIPSEYRDSTFLAVRVEEADMYDQKYGHRCRILPLTGVSHIGDTRQAIVNHFAGTRLWMMDDDLRFYKVATNEVTGKLFNDFKVTPEYWGEMLALAERAMDEGFSHGGISVRAALLDASGRLPWRPNDYHYTNTWLDLSVLPIDKINYAPHNLLEDLNVFMDLVLAGFNSATIYEYVAFQRTESHDPERRIGGCHVYRNPDNWDVAVKAAAVKYGDLVRYKTEATNRHGRSPCSPKIKRLLDRDTYLLRK